MAIIRPATVQDLPGAYGVCLLTGDAGRDASGLYRIPDLLGHLYVGPYIVGAPELASVVADDAGIAGYGLAVADTAAFRAWGEAHWWPALRQQYPPRSDGSSDARLVGRLHDPPRAPDRILATYPAHLHLDLLERVRGIGFGRALIERMLGQLRERRVSGVHLEVAIDNPNAVGFYRHLGFAEVDRGPGSLIMGVRMSD